jgi:hypothetical protein
MYAVNDEEQEWEDWDRDKYNVDNDPICLYFIEFDSYVIHIIYETIEF